jgi:hypothetical protein
MVPMVYILLLLSNVTQNITTHIGDEHHRRVSLDSLGDLLRSLSHSPIRSPHGVFEHPEWTEVGPIVDMDDPDDG